MKLEWAVASRALENGPFMGDGYCVLEEGRWVLLAVLDGLGHGEEASQATGVAAGVIKAHRGLELDQLLWQCHAALKKTRGAAISLASLDLETGGLVWTGVGNVEGLLQRQETVPRPSRERLLLKSGIVGYLLPPPRVAGLALKPGDTLVFYTDGIQNEFVDRVDWKALPGPLADKVLEGWAKATDDALVLVGRCLES